jgi:GT2 family glycosyltransferase
MDELTAVVLNFRTPDRTMACLRSLVAESILRIVMVENSEDGGAALLAMRPGLDRLREQGVRVDVIDESRNLGFAAGVNRALALIRADGGGEVLLVNSDASLSAGAIDGLLAAVRSGADLAAPVLSSPLHADKRPVFYYQACFALLTEKPMPGSFGYVAGACMLLSRTIAHPNLFDEDFFFYGEDVTLGAKMLQEGRTCIVVPESRFVHDGAGSARNGSLFYEYHINRGHWLLARKLSPYAAWYELALAGRVLVLPLRAFARSLRFRNAAPLWGLWFSIVDAINGRRRTFTPPPVK